ncbi:C40 family peptidase [Parafrankia sp. EUN1f]|uniref:C40 family peptidase n=1 Tax=Parafrankia sp. EUN1f TaxID=102897 RepID=UPI001E2A699B|nr:C40 family peptidase [Parafrankia sp. EUN1f]
MTTDNAPAPTVEPEPVVSTDDGLASRVLALVAQFEGTPYVYGGESPGGFDCSGLVQYVFGLAGVTLPRTTQQQYDASTKIPWSEIRPGDLVFFGSTNAIYHVGIYAGDGTMWAAPRPGKTVQLQKIWSTNVHAGRF